MSSNYIILTILICLALIMPVYATDVGILVVMEGRGLHGASCIASDDVGNIYTFGQISPVVDVDIEDNFGFGNKLAINKFDNCGNLMWTSSFPIIFNQDPCSLDFAVDNSGNMYVACAVRGSFSLSQESRQIIRIIPQESFLIKLDADGEFLRATRLDFVITGIDVDNNGNVYATGVAEWPYYNYQNPQDIVDDSMYKFVICKVSNGGIRDWYYTLNSYRESRGLSISYDNRHGIYVSGQIEGTVDFNPGPGCESYTSDPGKALSFVSKYDEEGNYQWSKVFEMDEAGVEFRLVVSCTDNDGNWYYAGRFYYDQSSGELTNADSQVFEEYQGILTGALSEIGEILWEDYFYYEGRGFNLKGVTVDKDHKLYLGGTLDDSTIVSYGNTEITLNAGDFGSPFLLVYESGRVDFEQSRVWQTERYTAVNDIEATSTGYLVISGYSSDSIFLQNETGSGNYIKIIPMS